MIVDLYAQKDTVKILADLNRAYPFADDETQENVQRYLGPINKEIVERARLALESGDMLALGTLMGEAQTGFDTHVGPACPEELAAPVLHKTLDTPELAESTLGGKGVGSQGDGSAQFLVPDAAAQREVMETLTEKFGLSCLPLTIPRTKRVRTAVITAAGLGTRLFPMTKVIRKEFMPVLDSSGTMMPLLIKHLLEAQAAGIEEILLIIRPEEEGAFRKLLLEPVAPEVFQKLSGDNQALARRLESLSERITLVPQAEQRGLGHAVLSVAERVGDEPFLLVLGDHHFVSHRNESTYDQLVAAYEHVDENIIGIVETDESEIHRFGTVGGSWERRRELLSISALREKPTIEEAREQLRVEGLSPSTYYTVFGLYILTPAIFDILRRMESDHEYDRGELQLTGALEHLRRERGMLGLPIDGEKIDIGVPDDFARALRRS